MNKKNLCDRIAERLKNTQEKGLTPRRANYLGAFLSQKEEIQQASAAGWRIKTIWQTLHDEGLFTGTYETFLGYFRKFISNSKGYLEESTTPAPNADSLTPLKEEASVPSVKPPKSRWKAETESGIFDYSPTMTDDKRKKIFGSEKTPKQEDSHG